MTATRPVNFSAHPNLQVRRDVAYLLTLNPILNLVPERVDRDTVARWLGAILRDMNESDKVLCHVGSMIHDLYIKSLEPGGLK